MINYDAIPEPMRTQMIVESARDTREIFYVAKILVENFDNLSSGLDEIFQQMTQDPKKSHYIASEILELYDPHPTSRTYKRDKENVNVNKKLLKIFFELVENHDVLLGVAGTILSNYRQYPEEIRKLLINIPEILRNTTQREHWDFLYHLIREYKELPKEIQAIVFDYASINPSELANHLVSSYNECPPELQELLPRLFKEGPDSRKLAKALSHVEISGRRRGVPETIFNQLLQILLDRGETLGGLEVIVYNFNDIREEYKQLFFSKSLDARYAGDLAVAIARNYKGLPDQLKNLLPTLCDYPTAKKQVIDVITYIYQDLPAVIRDKIFDLARIDELKGDVAITILLRARELPDAVVALLSSLGSALMEKMEKEFRNWDKDNSDWIPIPVHFGIFNPPDRRIPVELLNKVLNEIEKFMGSDTDYEHNILKARKNLSALKKPAQQ